MRELTTILVILLISSCIPVKIAHNIEGDKLMVAKKFKRDLPRTHGFVFEDPKGADEFYNFINMKFDRKDIDVESNVPIKIDNETYFLSFYERERETKTINLVPIAVDAKRESNGNDPMLQDANTSRSGQWYLILIVLDSEMNDCLSPNFPKREAMLSYLRELKGEYLTTQNYLETFLRRE